MRIDKYCLVWNNRTIEPRDWWPEVDGPRQCHLNAGIYPNEVLRFSNDSNLYVCTDYNDLFFMISKHFRCSLNFTISEANAGGFKTNDTWTGAVKLLAEGRADFFPHTFAPSGDRAEVIYYNFLVPHEEVLSMLSYPQAYSVANPFASIFSSFDSYFWQCLALVILFLGFVSSCLWKKNFLLGMFGILLGQQNHRLNIRVKNYFTALVYLFVFETFIIRQLFTSDSTALRIKIERKYIDNFDQIESEHLQALVFGGGSLKAFKDIYPQIAAKSIKLPREHASKSNTLGQLIRGHLVLVGEKLKLEELKQFFNYAPFHIAQQAFIPEVSNYPVRRSLNQPIRDRLAKLFRDVHQYGLNHKAEKVFIINKLYRMHKQYPTMSIKEVFRFIFYEYNPERYRKINNFMAEHDRLQNARLSLNLMLLYYICNVGFSFSFACFLLEVIFFFVQYFVTKFL